MWNSSVYAVIHHENIFVRKNSYFQRANFELFQSQPNQSKPKILPFSFLLNRHKYCLKKTEPAWLIKFFLRKCSAHSYLTPKFIIFLKTRFLSKEAGKLCQAGRKVQGISICYGFFFGAMKTVFLLFCYEIMRKSRFFCWKSFVASILDFAFGQFVDSKSECLRINVNRLTVSENIEIKF